jgi:CheY-like chemotaxis protein/signal transduction histidine kinase
MSAVTEDTRISSASREPAKHSDTRKYPAIVRYGVAVGVVALAFTANELIPLGAFPDSFLITGVMIAAQFGGRGPASVTFLLSSLVLDYFYVPPFHSLHIRPDLLPSIVQFVVPSLLGVWFIEKRREVTWLLERETEIGKRLQGELSLPEIGDAVLQYLAPELGAPVAAFYSVEADGTAVRRASFAFDVEGAPASFAPGQGALGQAVKDRRAQILEVPPDYVTVGSSLGRRRASQVLIVPATDDERARAALEIGFFKKIGQMEVALLERISETLAIAVRTANYRTQLKNLLEETTRQSDELKVQDEELRVANEELEERGRTMIDAQRKLEQQQAEVESANETLRDQTRLLSQQNEELAQAHQTVRLRSNEAERANHAKSEFLANMSHELRTPLNSSLILAKLLMEDRDGNLTAEQIRFAETIYSAGNDLLAMIDEILDLAKIESGKLDLNLEDVPFAKFRDDLVRTFEPLATERRLHFDVRLASSLPNAIRTDAQRVGQILKNLLSNAFKFTEKGQVSFAVESAHDRVHFVVRDTGIGIPADQLGSIFEAFQQADGTTNRRYGGTGLGLTISRDLARLLGGEITVTSTQSQGSTFTLDLPRELVAEQKLSEGVSRRAAVIPAENLTVTANLSVTQPAAMPAPPISSAPQKRTILIVEDDFRFADIVAELARELHFVPTIVATADEAIASAIEQRPDGIVLDIKLPDHSGLSVLDRLKRDPRTRHIPVHVISMADYMRTALEMGAIGYMLKPIEREQIKAALQKLEKKFTRTVRRLLVVEDDLTQRDAICQLLGAEGVEIIAVGTVSEALEQLRGGSLDCVVTDLALPDGSGYDLLRTMAMDEAYSFPSVVVYTGRSLSDAEEQRLRQYSSSIIVKGARSPERLLDEVTLFLHQVESTLPPERQRMLKKARHREAIFEDRQVLVVEDDVRNVFALTNVLEPKGMKVTIARNGREALEALDRNPSIDLVLMDIMMPEMDGLAATRAIRKQPKWAKLPIIALTAKAMKDDHARCLEAGASEYIPKPLDVDMLLSLLRVWIPK